MKRYFLLFVMFMCLSSSVLLGAADQVTHTTQKDSKGVILVISSYSPDSRRISTFMKSFEDCMVNSEVQYDVYLESLSVELPDGCAGWVDKIGRLLYSHEYDNISALILLGQEAWASFCALNIKSRNYPVFVSFASIYGLDLLSYNRDSLNVPLVKNLLGQEQKAGFVGGQFFNHFVRENVDLIMELYPSTKNICLITDNSYGGILLKEIVKTDFDYSLGVNLSFIDGTNLDFSEAQECVKNLSDDSAVLIGTWRIGKEGYFYLSSSLQKLISQKSEVPFFTIMGNGIEDDVIGGYVPVFAFQPEDIYNQIVNYFSLNEYCEPEVFTGHYIFNELMLNKLGFKSYQLPAQYEKQNVLEKQLNVYKNIIAAGIVALVLFAVLIIVLLIVSFRNIHLKKSLLVRNDELTVAKQAAEESEKMKSSFLANMSHEIRTPLNSIVGFSNLLCEGDLSPEESQEYKQIIINNSTSLLKLINDILDISRLESDKMKFSIKNCDVVSLCKSVLVSFEPMKKPNVEYIFKSAEEICVIKTDELRVRQVITNFINNSAKFTESGFIELSLEASQDKVLFIVTDTGSGIDPKKREAIFNRFEKINEFQQGFGLGLAISSQIAKKLGGRIYLDIEYTKGTRIVFEHPKVLDYSELERGGGENS